MERDAHIPPDVRERHPLITAEGWSILRRMREHRHAPRWTYEVGDRVTAADIDAAERMRALLSGREGPLRQPAPAMLECIASLRAMVLHYRDTLPAELDPERDWDAIPTMTRDALREHVEQVVPLDADLSRLIVYDTSGTTGSVIRVPTHPAVNAQNHALAEHALRAHGIRFAPVPGETSCLGVSAQASTYTFATIFSVWNQTGFAKINLKRSEWPDGQASARAYLGELDPRLLTGEPVSLVEAMHWELPVRPLAMISTATALAPSLQRKLAEHFACPVLDWYSLSETGPIAYSSSEGDGLCIFPSDLLVEVLDERQRALPLGEMGEIAVTTFRNPYLPLLRYRTGDHGRLVEVVDAVGRKQLRLRNLVARSSVRFRNPEGEVVNPVDIARVLNRAGVYVQHECVQRADGSLDLAVQPLAGTDPGLDVLLAGLREYFGPRQVLRVRAEASMPAARNGKRIGYRSELEA